MVRMDVLLLNVFGVIIDRFFRLGWESVMNVECLVCEVV